MKRKSDDVKNLLKPKQDTEELVKSTYYLTREQRKKLAHFSTISKRGKSELLRDMLDMIFDQLEEEERGQKEKADEDSPT